MEFNTIQSDFDKLALLDADNCDHNVHYHNCLLKHVPSNATQALEIGCGAGAFSRQLFGYVECVLAIDLSPDMIMLAQQRSLQYPNIEFQIADVLRFDFPEQQFDCVVSIATLHHLLLEHTLPKLRTALKPNGILLVLDLYQAEGLKEGMLDLLAVPVHSVLKLNHTGRI